MTFIRPLDECFCSVIYIYTLYNNTYSKYIHIYITLYRCFIIRNDKMLYILSLKNNCFYLYSILFCNIYIFFFYVTDINI